MRPTSVLGQQVNLRNLYTPHRVLNKVLHREGPPRVQPFTPLYIPFLTEKVPFGIPSTDKWYPFLTPSLELCFPFNCYECTAFKIWINDNTRFQDCSWIFQSHNFHLSKWHISLSFHLLQQVKSLPLHIADAWKRCPIRGEPLHIGHYKECPAPSPRVLYILDFISNSYHWLFCNANKVL